MKKRSYTLMKIIIPFLGMIFIWLAVQNSSIIKKADAELNYHLTPPYQQDTCNKINITMGETIVGDRQCVEGTPAHVGASL